MVADSNKKVNFFTRISNFLVSRETKKVNAFGVVTFLLIGFFVTLLVIKGLWGFIIPDLFPGAVKQGLIAKSISWATAMKVALLLVLLKAGRS